MNNTDPGELVSCSGFTGWVKIQTDCYTRVVMQGNMGCREGGRERELY